MIPAPEVVAHEAAAAAVAAGGKQAGYDDVIRSITSYCAAGISMKVNKPVAEISTKSRQSDNDSFIDKHEALPVRPRPMQKLGKNGNMASDQRITRTSEFSTICRWSYNWSPLILLLHTKQMVSVLVLLLLSIQSVESQTVNQSTEGSTTRQSIITTALFRTSLPSFSNGSTAFSNKPDTSFGTQSINISTSTTAVPSELASNGLTLTPTVGQADTDKPVLGVSTDSGLEGGAENNVTFYTTYSDLNVTSSDLNVTSSQGQPNYSSEDGGLSPEAIVGITVGCAVYLVAMIIIIHIICLCTRRRSMISASRLPDLPDSDWADHRGYRRYGTGGAGLRRKHPAVSGELYRQSVDDVLFPSRSSLNSDSSRGPIRPANTKRTGADQVRAMNLGVLGYDKNRSPVGGDPRYAWNSSFEREDSFRY